MAESPVRETGPRRLQRRRTKGYRLPEGAVIVDRTTIWGNPFKAGEKIHRDSDLWPYIAETVPGGAAVLAAIAPMTAEQAVDLYAAWLIEQPPLMLRLGEIAGRDLACWCPLPAEGEPDHCHAAFLLQLTNDEEAPRG
ncbi:DUF4326 domain-containing protein [Planomonospora sp. ID67723]|uniref:DUF4326 domain-containing protein n=1 Tax=Planomonospora sp. ID67723 TaxID=2738134 RepID=UPI0018C38B01|nr:DUF4326 domain-containing protein [Planomonospora sp. ID67723]MBG0828526.1 DUF4326 domain-containing protein [Planomonospora sp. ID67723]